MNNQYQGQNSGNQQGYVAGQGYQSGGYGQQNFQGHETANNMLLNAQIGRRQQNQNAQQRWEQFGRAPQGVQQAGSQWHPVGNQSQSSVSMGGGQSYGQPQGGYQQGGQPPRVPHLTYQQLENEYMLRYPKAYGRPIVAVKKDERGDIIAFQLDNGQILDYPQMLQASFDGALEGLIVQNNREGELIIRSAPDGFRSNNLDQLPEIH